MAAVLVLGADGEDGRVLCPCRLATGGYCPTCGMTRAVGHLVRGDVPGSLAAHPYVVFAVAQLAVIAVLWWAWRGRPDHRHDAWIRWRPALIGLNVLLLVGLWAVRLALGVIPAPFA